MGLLAPMSKHVQHFLIKVLVISDNVFRLQHPSAAHALQSETYQSDQMFFKWSLGVTEFALQLENIKFYFHEIIKPESFGTATGK